MLDYYALPSDTPGAKQNVADIYQKVSLIEDGIKSDINANNLIPNIMLHEFEALLFSNPKCFSYCGLSEKCIKQLCDIRLNVLSPEHINSNKNTAPSKRILCVYPGYNKVTDGYNIAKDIGIHTMRQECKHFNEWIEKLLQL